MGCMDIVINPKNQFNLINWIWNLLKGLYSLFLNGECIILLNERVFGKERSKWNLKLIKDVLRYVKYRNHRFQHWLLK